MRMDCVRRFLLVGMLVGGGLLTFSALTFGCSIQALAQVALYAFLCELYIFCFTLVLSSVSVTMLILLRGGPVSVSALTTKYDPQGMVDLRLERLVQQGLIVERGGHFAVTPVGMRLHRAFAALQRFFRHDARYSASG
jgi:hypothetical protein